MWPTTNKSAAADPQLKHFARHLIAERNVSPNTLSAYISDLTQLAASKFGPDAVPPFDWAKLDEAAARNFLVSFSKTDALTTTVRRKLAAGRAFCKFLLPCRHIAVKFQDMIGSFFKKPFGCRCGSADAHFVVSPDPFALDLRHEVDVVCPDV